MAQHQAIVNLVQTLTNNHAAQLQQNQVHQTQLLTLQNTQHDVHHDRSLFALRQKPTLHPSQTALFCKQTEELNAPTVKDLESMVRTAVPSHLQSKYSEKRQALEVRVGDNISLAAIYELAYSMKDNTSSAQLQAVVATIGTERRSTTSTSELSTWIVYMREVFDLVAFLKRIHAWEATQLPAPAQGLASTFPSSRTAANQLVQNDTDFLTHLMHKCLAPDISAALVEQLQSESLEMPKDLKTFEAKLAVLERQHKNLVSASVAIDKSVKIFQATIANTHLQTSTSDHALKDDTERPPKRQKIKRH
jgi:hypothetical protein